MRLIFVELSCLQAKIENVHVEINPHFLENSSRLSIFELNQDTPEIHSCYKFGPNATFEGCSMVFGIFSHQIEPVY